MWIDASRDVPTEGSAVIGVWSERYDRDCGWCVMTTDGWYYANPDGSPINRCPAPVMWSKPPLELQRKG